MHPDHAFYLQSLTHMLKHTHCRRTVAGRLNGLVFRYCPPLDTPIFTDNSDKTPKVRALSYPTPADAHLHTYCTYTHTDVVLQCPSTGETAFLRAVSAVNFDLK